MYIRNTNSVTTSRFASTHIFWFRVSAMPHKGLKRRNAKKDQVTKYIQMGMFIIETGQVQFLVQKLDPLVVRQ